MASSMSPAEARHAYETGCPRSLGSYERHVLSGYWHGIKDGRVSCNAPGIPRGSMQPTLSQATLDDEKYGASIDIVRAKRDGRKWYTDQMATHGVNYEWIRSNG